MKEFELVEEFGSLVMFVRWFTTREFSIYKVNKRTDVNVSVNQILLQWVARWQPAIIIFVHYP